MYKTFIKRFKFRDNSHIIGDCLKYTRFEKARIIGARALQISLGAPVLTEVSEKMFDPVEIATVEYNKDAIPITVWRGN